MLRKLLPSAFLFAFAVTFAIAFVFGGTGDAFAFAVVVAFGLSIAASNKTRFFIVNARHALTSLPKVRDMFLRLWMSRDEYESVRNDMLDAYEADLVEFSKWYATLRITISVLGVAVSHNFVAKAIRAAITKIAGG